MTERSILIAPELAPAVWDGTKTQTRRVMVPQPNPAFLARGVVGITPQWPAQDGVRWFMADGLSELVRCPYGGPGDRLYWANEPIEFIGINSLPGACRQVGVILSLFDGSQQEVPIPDVDNLLNGRKVKRPVLGRWRGRRLPIEWARDWRLGVTDVRVQRVAETSEEDARAEGVDAIPRAPAALTHRTAFAGLWDFINAKPKLRKRNPYTLAPEPCYVSFPWEDVRETRTHRGLPYYVVGNPFTWALTFERIDDG